MSVETASLWVGLWDLLRQTEPRYGCYDVEVGPGYSQLSLPELRTRRPDGLARVRWDPVSEIRPITPTQRLRVEQHVVATDTPGR